MLKTRENDAENRQELQRRGFDRAPVNIALTYSIAGDGPFRNARATDLSGSGVRISSVKQLARGGGQIALEFRLPNSDRVVTAHGRLVMSFFDGKAHQYSHGIAFTQISKSDQEAIVQCVRETLAP